MDYGITTVIWLNDSLTPTEHGETRGFDRTAHTWLWVPSMPTRTTPVEKPSRTRAPHRSLMSNNSIYHGRLGSESEVDELPPNSIFCNQRIHSSIIVGVYAAWLSCSSWCMSNVNFLRIWTLKICGLTRVYREPLWCSIVDGDRSSLETVYFGIRSVVSRAYKCCRVFV